MNCKYGVHDIFTHARRIEVLRNLKKTRNELEVPSLREAIFETHPQGMENSSSIRDTKTEDFVVNETRNDEIPVGPTPLPNLPGRISNKKKSEMQEFFKCTV